MVAPENDAVPLNAIKVFVAIAREQSVTRAALSLGIAQSAASRQLIALEKYLGEKLVVRRGRFIELTTFGRIFADGVTDALDTINFMALRMRRSHADNNRLTVRTSLSTFAYSSIIPNLHQFSADHNGAVVDVVASLAQPAVSDQFDVLVTRDLEVASASEHWDLLEEQLVCAGIPSLVSDVDFETLVRETPFVTVISRPDSLPTWAAAMQLPVHNLKQGARYEHHYLAIPAVVSGQGVIVAPEIIIADLIAEGVLSVVAGSRVRSGMWYRAYALDKSASNALTHQFCRWLKRICRDATSKLSAQSDRPS